MELTESLKEFFKATAKSLKGGARRVFMARTVHELGKGGQSEAIRELGWSQWSIDKGRREWASGITCVDAFNLRGCKPLEARLPNLLADIRAIVDGQSQTDPQFRNQRLYTRLSVEEVRRQLIAQKGYSDAELPKREALRLRINLLGYYPQTVAKARPKKRSPKPTPSFPS